MRLHLEGFFLITFAVTEVPGVVSLAKYQYFNLIKTTIIIKKNHLRYFFRFHIHNLILFKFNLN